MSEEELIAKCRKKSEKAFKQLYYEYHRPLMLICMRYARDRDEANDMFQCGFIRIIQSIDSFKGAGSFIGWLKRIMVNESINYFNRVNKKGRLNYSDNDGFLESRQELVPASAYADLAYSELIEMVKQLPPGYRMVFCLYAIEGFSHKEVAEKLEIGVSTSKSNLTRARALLRKRLAERDNLEKKSRVQNG